MGLNNKTRIALSQILMLLILYRIRVTSLTSRTNSVISQLNIFESEHLCSDCTVLHRICGGR